MTAALPAQIRPRLGQLIRLLASNHDGERLAAARALDRTLAANGADWHSLAATVEAAPVERIVYRDRPVPQQAEPQSWRELAAWVRDNDRGRLAPHERTFARDMASRLILKGEPTDKQGAWLRSLYAKLRAGT